MTKNTKANITLIFAINKKNTELSKALEAIDRQTDKNCNLVFVFNGASQSEKDIFKNFEFKGFNKVDLVLISEGLGDSYAFNYVKKHNLSTKWFYYFDSNVILKPDFLAALNKFVDEHPDADIVSFFGVPNIYFKQDYITIKTLSDDFCNRPLVFFDNKLLNIEYIEKSKVNEPMFKHYPMYYYVQLIKNNPHWYSLGRQICNGSSKPIYMFNVFDLFDQCVECVNLLDKPEFKEHRSEIEYLCIVTLFRNFINAILVTHKMNFMYVKKVLNKIEQFMNTNFPTWQENEFLTSKKNKNDKSYLKYLKEFKPKLTYVLKASRIKLFVQGHAKSK